MYINAVVLDADLEVNSQHYHNRWMELHKTGILNSINAGIVVMQNLANEVAGSNKSMRMGKLDDLEWCAFGVTKLLPSVLVLSREQAVSLPFKPGYILAKATAQYLVNPKRYVERAILRGSLLAEKVLLEQVTAQNMDSHLAGYYNWATKRLLKHLIYESNYWDEETFGKVCKFIDV